MRHPSCLNIIPRCAISGNRIAETRQLHRARQCSFGAEQTCLVIPAVSVKNYRDGLVADDWLVAVPTLLVAEVNPCSELHNGSFFHLLILTSSTKLSRWYKLV